MDKESLLINRNSPDVVRKFGMVMCTVKQENRSYFQIQITCTKGWRPEFKDKKSYEWK